MKSKKLALKRKRALTNIPAEQRFLKELLYKENIRKYVIDQAKKQNILLEEGFEPIDRRVRRHLEAEPLFKFSLEILENTKIPAQFKKNYDEIEKFFRQGYLNAEQLREYKRVLDKRLEWLGHSTFGSERPVDLIKSINEQLKTKSVDVSERVKIPKYGVLRTPAQGETLEEQRIKLNQLAEDVMNEHRLKARLIEQEHIKKRRDIRLDDDLSEEEKNYGVLELGLDSIAKIIEHTKKTIENLLSVYPEKQITDHIKAQIKEMRNVIKEYKRQKSDYEALLPSYRIERTPESIPDEDLPSPLFTDIFKPGETLEERSTQKQRKIVEKRRRREAEAEELRREAEAKEPEALEQEASEQEALEPLLSRKFRIEDKKTPLVDIIRSLHNEDELYNFMSSRMQTKLKLEGTPTVSQYMIDTGLDLETVVNRLFNKYGKGKEPEGKEPEGKGLNTRNKKHLTEFVKLHYNDPEIRKLSKKDRLDEIKRLYNFFFLLMKKQKRLKTKH